MYAIQPEASTWSEAFLATEGLGSPVPRPTFAPDLGTIVLIHISGRPHISPRLVLVSSDTPRLLLGLDGGCERASAVEPIAFDSGQEPTAADKLDAKLLAYTELPQGWDGKDGRPASWAAYEDARSFLGLLAELSELPLPKPQISPDGELGLYWKHLDVFADVGFYGDGTLSFYAEASGKEFGKDAWDIAKDVPPELVQVLSHLAIGNQARAA